VSATGGRPRSRGLQRRIGVSRVGGRVIILSYVEAVWRALASAQATLPQGALFLDRRCETVVEGLIGSPSHRAAEGRPRQEGHCSTMERWRGFRLESCWGYPGMGGRFWRFCLGVDSREFGQDVRDRGVGSKGQVSTLRENYFLAAAHAINMSRLTLLKESESL
jgi:hypothetical protein